MTKLGKHQLERLLGMASPSALLIVGGDRISQSLVKRGLLKPVKADDPEAWLQITPAGMRELADAFEAGLLEQFFNWPPKLREAIDNARSAAAAGAHDAAHANQASAISS